MKKSDKAKKAIAKKVKQRRKWNKAHEFQKRKKTKNEEGHPAYIYKKSGNQRKYVAFTHSPTTDGKDNEILDKNIDGSEDDCYAVPTPKIAKVDTFEKPDKEYKFRTKRDYELIKTIIKGK